MKGTIVVQKKKDGECIHARNHLCGVSSYGKVSVIPQILVRSDTHYFSIWEDRVGYTDGYINNPPSIIITAWHSVSILHTSFFNFFYNEDDWRVVTLVSIHDVQN